MIDWHFPSKPQEFSADMRLLIHLSHKDKHSRLRLYRQMGYSWQRLKELGILTDEC